MEEDPLSLKAGATGPGQDPGSFTPPCSQLSERCFPFPMGNVLPKVNLISPPVSRKEGFLAIRGLEIGKSLTEYILNVNLI